MQEFLTSTSGLAYNSSSLRERDGGRVAWLDIGIDLGTCNIYAMSSAGKTVLCEPSVVAVDKRTGKVMGAGAAVYDMLGKTPGHIEVVRPLRDGVISDFGMTEVLIRHLLGKITKSQLLKPRVCLCVTSEITGVESQAVIDATVAAGARKVYLIEEPVAGAIGAGIDLSLPRGNMIIDVGGGTTDIAVLSLNGIVCKTSVKVAGHAFDEALVRYMRQRYNILIGERTAERLKFEAGAVSHDCPDASCEVKGRDLISGLPRKITVTRKETLPVLGEVMDQILAAAVSVLEKTPPELAGDIRESGVVLTGGGVQLTGFAQAVSARAKIPARLAGDPERSVVMGTAKSFDYLDKLYDGFVGTGTAR